MSVRLEIEKEFITPDDIKSAVPHKPGGGVAIVSRLTQQQFPIFDLKLIR